MTREQPNYGKVWEEIEELQGEERKPYELDMELSVREAIERARVQVSKDPDYAKKQIPSVRSAASLLKGSLLSDVSKPPKIPAWTGDQQKTDFPSPSFASWFIERGLLLGGKSCHEIGVRVCKELGFTVQEANDILVNYPEPEYEKKE
jgi:hypothetical protein